MPERIYNLESALKGSSNMDGIMRILRSGESDLTYGCLSGDVISTLKGPLFMLKDTLRAGLKVREQPSSGPFDVHEAARRLNCRPWLVRKLAKDRLLKSRRVGRFLRFCPQDVDEYLSREDGTVTVKEPQKAVKKRRPKCISVVKTQPETEDEKPTAKDIRELWDK